MPTRTHAGSCTRLTRTHARRRGASSLSGEKTANPFRKGIARAAPHGAPRSCREGPCLPLPWRGVAARWDACVRTESGGIYERAALGAAGTVLCAAAAMRAPRHPKTRTGVHPRGHRTQPGCRRIPIRVPDSPFSVTALGTPASAQIYKERSGKELTAAGSPPPLPFWAVQTRKKV